MVEKLQEESNPELFMQFFGSGAAWIHIYLAHTDPDPVMKFTKKTNIEINLIFWLPFFTYVPRYVLEPI
jgi:hypothetical protein